jgi:DNA-binding CsgD family transcriptional regulator
MNSNPERQQWLDALVQRHEQPLCRYAYSLLGSLSAAQDAVQETFLRLCRENPGQTGGTRGGLAVPGLPVPGPGCVAQGETHAAPGPRAHRADGRRRPHPGPTRRPRRIRTTGPAPAWTPCPPNEREVIRLKFQHDLSYREIARITRLTESNVGYLIHQGLKSLRHQMAVSPGSRIMNFNPMIPAGPPTRWANSTPPNARAWTRSAPRTPPRKSTWRKSAPWPED